MAASLGRVFSHRRFAPLLPADSKGMTAVVELMLARGADVNAKFGKEGCGAARRSPWPGWLTGEEHAAASVAGGSGVLTCSLDI